MPEQSDVKVFISWSGDLAKDVAVALREWLPLLFDRVAPWASDTDIAAGQRGLAQIEAELTNTSFGIVVVTSENQHAPWLNFEAGALSKTVVGDVEHRVVPLLVDLTGPTQLTGPLAQFQAKTVQRDGMRDLVLSLAAIAGIEEGLAAQRFEAWWPKLEIAITEAKVTDVTPAAKQTKRLQSEVIDEILLHVRALRSESEHDSSRNLSKRRATTKRGFHTWLDKVAAEHGFKVDLYPGPRGDFKREVHLSPVGSYTSEAAEAFERAFAAGVAEEDKDVVIMVVPF